MKVAIIGASGFVGLRLIERWHLTGKAEVIPVVHTYRSLAVLARFALPWRVVNPADAEALAEALKGCDAVVHAALGDAKQIVAMAQALYPAAEKAGVKRIVALSSASVHGLAPAQGTDENSPPLVNQKIEYNAAKAKAELLLTEARRAGKTELVQIRPSVVFGPRSRFIADISRQLLEGSAYLIDEGRGICNAVSADNLIDAIWQALTVPEADGHSFLVNDPGCVTWADFYGAIAVSAGMDLSGVYHIAMPVFQPSVSDKLAKLAAQKTVLAALPRVPARVKRLAKAAAAAWPAQHQSNAWRLPEGPRPHVTEEICTLQSCRWRYPTTKAEQILKFVPGESFEDGMRRTAAWMEFVGLAQNKTP